MLRSMRSESLGARRPAVAPARLVGTPPPCAPTPGFSVTWFASSRVAHRTPASPGLLVPAFRGGDAGCQPLHSEDGAARPLARRRITALPALAAAVIRRPLPARRGECDDPHQANSDQQPTRKRFGSRSSRAASSLRPTSSVAAAARSQETSTRAAWTPCFPGMEAAFVDIGLEKNGFLYVDEIVMPDLDERERRRKPIQDLIKAGEELLVQVVKDPMGTKGARLTMEVSLAGRFMVLQPRPGGRRRVPPPGRRRARPAARPGQVDADRARRRDDRAHRRRGRRRSRSSSATSACSRSCGRRPAATPSAPRRRRWSTSSRTSRCR